MTCVQLKNGARIYFSDEAFKDKDYMKVVVSEVSGDESKNILSPAKEGQYKKLREFIRSLSKGEISKNITILKD